ncbi:MAG: PEP-CTERM sorting domain-containing protein, partial [Burkholderiaceae bacterium]|nr:PEP-CTERM sorting domain-containing protein [Burkholderiaceae bacterium]
AFQFSDLDTNPSFRDGIDWSVEKNSGSGALANGSFANGGNSGSLTVSKVVVAAGDRINFIVGPNSDYQGDSSRLSAVITATPLGSVSPVPEPGSLALWLAGGALLITTKGRRNTR